MVEFIPLLTLIRAICRSGYNSGMDSYQFVKKKRELLGVYATKEEVYNELCMLFLSWKTRKGIFSYSFHHVNAADYSNNAGGELDCYLSAAKYSNSIFSGHYLAKVTELWLWCRWTLGYPICLAARCPSFVDFFDIACALFVGEGVMGYLESHTTIVRPCTQVSSGCDMQ